MKLLGRKSFAIGPKSDKSRQSGELVFPKLLSQPPELICLQSIKTNCSHRWTLTGALQNYLSVGQIYLPDNPLLKEPLKRKHVTLRLVGHWGTTPGLNFIYVHLNRMIKLRT